MAGDRRLARRRGKRSGKGMAGIYADKQPVYDVLAKSRKAAP